LPELPDITIYLEALEARALGRSLVRVDVLNPFLLRTAVPPLTDVGGRSIVELRRLGKRIAIGLEGDLWLMLHLMIAGRLHWHSSTPKKSQRTSAIFVLDRGSMTLTEAGTKKRASLHLVEGQVSLASHDPGGLELVRANFDEFAIRLTQTNHTLKRALTDPRILSGIGNAYSDQILHRARLSPVQQTKNLDAQELLSLFKAACAVLEEWTSRLRPRNGEFPEKVTAFRDDMAVHGRYGQPCPDCGTKVQRIRYAANETNYCPRCQTGGKLLADRSLSRLLKKDWPRTIDELERRGEAG
jgi:formamidopyrimidine-DNA glycosylase